MPRVLKNAKSMHEGKKHASLESIHDGKSKIQNRMYEELDKEKS